MANARSQEMTGSGSGLRSIDASSVISLLWGTKGGSTQFRTGKGGFKIPKYQNTYRLNSYKPYNVEVVDKILKEVMIEKLTDKRYEPTLAVNLCKEISADVSAKIFRKDFDRYKYIVQVTIIEKTGQGIYMGQSRLFDFERDSFSTYVFDGPNFYAVGYAVGVYYE